MLKRFTVESLRILYVARRAASEHGSHAVQNEHLLLGLLDVTPTVLTRACGGRCSADDVQQQVLTTLPTPLPIGERLPVNVELAMAPETTTALERAMQEADNLSQEVRPEHVLLALLEDERGVGRLLRDVEVSRGSIVASLRQP
jgi:ATP-dependent Clp protease ATP-binding subunit ClpA